MYIFQKFGNIILTKFLESNSKERSCYNDTLNESLNIQNKIYNLMAEKGWYKTEIADQSKIDCVKNKFANA